jgi:DNA-binding transcriptional regulator LsrR (DeoR family)
MDVIDLDKSAAEIARKHLLKGVSFRELGRTYHASPSTVQRRLTRWLTENRFDLRDRMSEKKTAVIVARDDELGERLARKTGIWRARVVQITGAEEAYRTEILEDQDNGQGEAVSRASDELHRCLGEVAGELILTSLRKNITVGLSSGRAVGFAVEKMGELVQRTPSWGKGFESARLVSLCGGAHIGMCESSNRRDFDADENIFTLASLLRVPRRNVAYMIGPVSSNQNNSERWSRNRFSLDLAVIGLGQLNTRHHYFRDYNELQLKALSGPIHELIESQTRDPERAGCIAEVVLRLYPTINTDLAPEYNEAIRKTNSTIVAVPPESLKKASEIMLIAGGRQKLAALSGILKGECLGAPIEKTSLTLITDAWTAEQLLQMT